MNTNANLSKGTWLQLNERRAARTAILWLLLLLLLLCLAPATATAQTYTVLHSFGTNVMGLRPRAPLVQGPDGALYGTTEQGGSANRGQVFKVNPDGSCYTVLKDFSGSDGAYPDGGLVLSGRTLYGTTAMAQLEFGERFVGNGTVFAINIDGTDFTNLHLFLGYPSDGANPSAGLILSGNTLYGTTVYGGNSDSGTVFILNTDGTGYATLYQFTATDPATGTNSDGAGPQDGLTLSANTLYGTAEGGGTSGGGTVFAVSTDGSGFTVLREFTGTDGASPQGSLVLSGTALYGTTSGGGSNGGGTVFAINADGSGFTVLKDFTNSTDGEIPNAGLVLSGTTLYGTSAWGGSLGYGNLFMVNRDGSGFAVLKDFTNSNGGANMYGRLMVSGTNLFGTTYYGGNSGCGTVFRVETDGSGYAVIQNFEQGDGAYPCPNVTLSGTTLYGTTQSGGRFGNGVIFREQIDGSGYAVLKDFTNSLDGVAPSAGMVCSNSTLYGTCYGGGQGLGTVFKINTDGSGFRVVEDFTNWIEAAYPNSSLVLSGSTLYGTTAGGGTNGRGTVFKVNTDGTSYTVLKAFSYRSDGAYPGGLVLSGTTLYGTARDGGGWDGGTVFKVNTDGSDFAVLRNFAYGFDANDGRGPGGGLVLSGTTLYGTTAWGGTNRSGTVFKIDTDGSGYTLLYSLSAIGSTWNDTNADGAYPNGSLLLAGTTLYGTTIDGGGGGYGTLFAVNTDGSGFTVLKAFSGSDGSPHAGLVLSGATLCGTRSSGGGLDCGTLFSLSLLPAIAMSPQTQTAEAGATVRVAVLAAGQPPPAYQWYFNGTNILSCTNSYLVLTNILFSQFGTYTVVVTNLFGAMTSAPVMLSVITPVERRPVPVINLMAPAGSFLGLDYRDNLGPTANWETMATMTLSNSSQYCFDASQPLPPQRYYRAWQTGTPSVIPSLSLPGMVPAITLTGNIGGSVRLDYINRFGPIDAWVTLVTVTLTNTSQLYFDTSSIGQPARLWRIVPAP